MMSDLTQLFEDFERDEFVAANRTQLPESRRLAVRTKVVRARRGRATATVFVYVLAVAAMGSGAWAVAHQDNSQPAITIPSPSASADALQNQTPSPSATADTVLSMPAFSGNVTIDEHLPSATAITPEAWNAAGPGWVLATYQEEMYQDYDYDVPQRETPKPGPQVAYLVSPDGVRYEVTPIHDDGRVAVVAWDPQSSIALALSVADASGENGSTHSGEWRVLDLETGTLRDPTERDVSAAGWTLADIEPFSVQPGSEGGLGWWGWVNVGPLPFSLPAAGASGAMGDAGDVAAAIATAQALVPSTETCEKTVKLNSGVVVVACGSLLPEDLYEQGAVLNHHFVFVADGGKGEGDVVDVQLSGPFGPETLYLGVPVGNSVVSMAIQEGLLRCQAGRAAVSATGGVQPLPGVTALQQVDVGVDLFYGAGAVGSSVYTVVSGSCSGGTVPQALVRDDIDSKTYTVLIPFPAWWQPDGGPGPWPMSSIVSAYVVPAGR